MRELKAQNILESYKYLPEITRTLKEKGFLINEAGTLETQIMVMNAHIENLLCNDDFIVDRCILDGYAYTRWLHLHKEGTIPEWFARYANELAERYVASYDHIFFLPIEFDVEDDGVRSTQPQFREQVNNLLTNKIELHRYPNMHVIGGTVQQRVEQISTILGVKHE